MNLLQAYFFFSHHLAIEQGTIPSEWKKAMITPIFKKGSCTDPMNYRPISLTSIICKILGHIIYSHIMSHLDCNNIITDTQYGFRQKRSANLQLLQTVHDLTLGLNEKGHTDCILLDFSKAFDKVPQPAGLLSYIHTKS